MSVIRIKKSNNYVVLHKGALENPHLSFKAKGLWAYCMSRPDDWEFRISHLKTVSKEGEDAIYSALNELIDQGYCQRVQSNNGRFGKMEYHMFEIPQEIQKILPQPDFQDAGKSHAENPALLSNDIVLSKENNNSQGDKETNVVVFSKKYFTEHSKDSLEEEQIEYAWKQWSNLEISHRSKIGNPIGWFIECGRKKYVTRASAVEENIKYLKNIENYIDSEGKSNLVHIDKKQGFILFTDCPSVSYSVKDANFLVDVSNQLVKRKLYHVTAEDKTK